MAVSPAGHPGARMVSCWKYLFSQWFIRIRDNRVALVFFCPRAFAGGVRGTCEYQGFLMVFHWFEAVPWPYLPP